MFETVWTDFFIFFRSPEIVDESMFRRILFPTDLSENSLAPMSLLKELAEKGSDELILLHVISESDVEVVVESIKITDGPMADARSVAIDRIRSARERRLRHIERDLTRHFKKVKTVIDIGRPSKVIAEVAEREKVSLIVMASRGRAKLPEDWIGSTSMRVIMTTSIPVLVCKRPCRE